MDWTKSGPTFYFFFDNIFHSDVCHNAEEITYRYFRFIATLKNSWPLYAPSLNMCIFKSHKRDSRVEVERIIFCE